MGWLVTAIVASTVVNVASSIKQGKDAKDQANREADQMERDRRLTAVESKQRNNDRVTEYQDARSTNDAIFAFLGRDTTDQSVKAFLAKQQEVAFEDVSRSGLQSRMEQAKLASQANDRRIAGKNAQTASYYEAASSIAGGLYKYKTAKI